MKSTITLFIAIFSVVAVFAEDATFESSDGLWTDRTFDKKGRNFLIVLRGFEDYKFRTKKPNLELVRITPEPKWGFFDSKKERSDPKWNVPYGASSGKAERQLAPRQPLTEEQKEEIYKRADFAFDYWSKQ